MPEKRSFLLLFFLFGIFTLLCPSMGRAEYPAVNVGVGYDFSTGDYGSEETSDYWSFPLSVDYYHDPRLDFQLVIPYIYQSSGSTILSGGQRFAVDRPRRGQRDISIVEPIAVEVEESESGLGDISLTGGYLLAPEGRLSPSVRAYLFLKVPTADEEKNLGTGTFDYGPGLELSKWLERWYTSVSASYTFQGSNDEFELKDYFTFGAEAGRGAGQRLFVSASLWGATPPSENSTDLLELRLNGTLRLSDIWSLDGYLARGLTDGSSDFGAGLTLYRSF